MATATTIISGRAPRGNTKPRAWICTRPLAIWCTLCGDCTCTYEPTARRNHSCPLHGAASCHGTRREMVA